MEGGNTNDWSEWEKKNAQRLASEAAARFGTLPNWKDISQEASNPDNYISGLACDHYRRFKDDFALAKKLGHNATRFSIEWSRVEPEEGVFDTSAIDHYREVLQTCRANGLKPFVTLWHWSTPLWISQSGGWENPRTIEKFLKYTERLADEYKDLIKFWMPLNEPGTYVGMSYIQGAFPPQKRLALFSANRVFKNLMKAHRGAYRTIHQKVPDACVGLSHYAVFMRASRESFWNKRLIQILDYYRNWRFLDSVDDANDFIGIQYYHADVITFMPRMNGRWGFIDAKSAGSWTTDMGWDVVPEGMYYLLKRVAAYRKPIYITENGIADRNDRARERFIRENLRYVLQAVTEGVDVRGYFYWSLLDNFEWDKGFWPRFGLVEIDFKTMERKPRSSAYAYQKIIAHNSL